MSIVIDGKPAEYWLRRRYLKHAAIWVVALLAIGIVNYLHTPVSKAGYNFSILLNLVLLACWIGVAVSLFRAWRSSPGVPNGGHP